MVLDDFRRDNPLDVRDRNLIRLGREQRIDIRGDKRSNREQRKNAQTHSVTPERRTL